MSSGQANAGRSGSVSVGGVGGGELDNEPSADALVRKAANRAVQQLQTEDSAALNYLARRGSEADRTSEEEFDDEAMANAERELAADAEWKRIQQNTFTRWANEHLRQAGKQIEDLETDLSDGLKLISLIEVLSGKRMPRHNKKPTFRSQKLENVSIALQFLELEGVTLVNIDSTDIVDCKLKLILGLIWTLILHYAISMPMWDGPPLGGGGAAQEKTPKQRLMNWIQDKVPDLPVNNFTKDWQNGKAVGALVDSVAPGLCPDWEDWDPNKPIENAREAMDLADKWLNVPKLLTPEEIVNPNIDEQSMMTYLSQFPNAKLKPGAPLRKKTNVGKVRAYGPGLEPKGLVAKAPAKFVVETFGAGDGDVTIAVTGPHGHPIPSEVICNHDRKKSYSCKYFPEEEGDYVVKVFFATREIPKSPYSVNVEGFAGDANKVTASGPGLEQEGVVINKPTFFHIYAKNAGKGTPEVVIIDPKGKKDSVPVRISPTNDEDAYKCEYVATILGVHSVNVFFAGNPIPKSPFGVKVSPSSIPGKVWTSGKGLQPNGIRVNDTVDFQVHTEGAGEGNVAVKILGPGGLPVRTASKKNDDFTTEYTYTPVKDGRHIVMITFANQEISRSPFEVNISPFKKSNIRAFGPGLKGGIVNKPAKFTVDTCGETGGLGFSIKGPSQAQINCVDNGDGSADVDYTPTSIGEYAVHILCDEEDIPGSPFMAQIVPQTDYYPENVKVYGPGIENGVNPNETTVFTIDITKAGEAPLDVGIRDELGEFKPKMKEISDGIFECNYQPRKNQHKQTVMVNFGGVAVPGSPFRVQNDNPNDPSKVKVYGPGVENGVKARKPVEFTIDCKLSGSGDLKVAIESKSRKSVPISMSDNKDGTYRVSYEPTEPGSQTITITLDGKPVPQSPIKIDVKPGPDLRKIRLKDFETDVFVDCTNEFEVDTSALPSNPKAKVTCDIAGPSGEPVDSYVSKLEPDGPFQVSYIPNEEGNHEIGLKYDGESLPDSPFPVVARYGSDPSRVKAFGDGLERGIVDEPNEFTIETKNAGAGGLGLAIEGPSEAIMNCVDNKDGTATVEYTPTEEGDYDIAVKFGDDNIPGSPFRVPVMTRDGKPKADSRKVRAYGPGLEPGNVLPGKPTNFVIDASETGPAALEVDISNGKGNKVPKRPSITDKGEGIYDVTYVPPLVGEPYEISVKYGGEDIPNSPFKMTSNPNLEDVINSPRSAKELGSGRNILDNTPDLVYAKNGSSVQRKGSKDGNPAGGVADLVRNTIPGSALGKERGGRPSDDNDDDAFNSNSHNKKGYPDAHKSGRLSSGDLFEPNSASRRGSQLRGDDGSGNRTLGTPGDHLYDGKPGTRQPYGRADSGDSLPDDQGSNKKSLHGSSPNSKGGLYDKFPSQGRKGSGGDGRPKSRNEDDSYSSPNDRKTSNSSSDDGARPYGRKGSGNDSKSPYAGHRGGVEGAYPSGRKGSGSSGKPDSGDAHRRGSDSSAKSGSKSPHDDDDAFGRRGSKGDGKHGPHTHDRSPQNKEGLGKDGLPMKSSSFDDNNDGFPSGRKGPGSDGKGKPGTKGVLSDDGDDSSPHGRKGSGNDGALGAKRSPHDSSDDASPYGRRGSGNDGRPSDRGTLQGDDFGNEFPHGRTVLGNVGRQDPSRGALRNDGRRASDNEAKPGSKGDDSDYASPYGRNGRPISRGSLVEDTDPTSPYGKKGSRHGSGDVLRDGEDPYGQPLGSLPYGRQGSNYGKPGGLHDSHVDDDGFPRGRKGSQDAVYDSKKPIENLKGRVPADDKDYSPYGRKGSGGSIPHGPDALSDRQSGSRPAYDDGDVDGKRGPFGYRTTSKPELFDTDGQRSNHGPQGRNSGPDLIHGKTDGPYGGRSSPYDNAKTGNFKPIGVRNDSLHSHASNVERPGFKPGAFDDKDPNSAFGNHPSFRSDPYASGKGPHGTTGPYSGHPDSRPDDLHRGSFGDDSHPLFPPLELNNIPLLSTGGNVEAVVKTPSGGLAFPYVEDNGNGSIGLSYQPTERGPHSVDVKNNDDHVQGSPYKFYASPLDDNKVHAYGPGLTHGVCGDPANFVISTRGAGAGGLALAVEGPSKADINCQDNKDGTVNVSYLPTAPGEYKISAKFADKHIEGSPFTCKVTGEGKKRNAISVGASSDLTLPDNLSEYDLRALNAYIISPSGNEEPCYLKKLPKGNTGISFTPKEVGEHLVSVKRNGKNIKNSPFKIKVSPSDVGDASKVIISGKGLSDGKTHQDNFFHVDTKNAGYGGLSLSVEGPSKAEISCKDHEDGTLDVAYKPTEPGLYIINLKFADQHVPGSPFAVAVSGQGSKKEEEKIDRLREAVPVTEVGSQCRLTFKMPGISCKDLVASVASPSAKTNKAVIAELEDGLYAVNFVPYELGIHTVSVQYHEIDIPGSPFQFTVGPLQDGGAHRVHAGGSGLERGIQGQAADFNVWTREAGHGSLAISVEGPSKAVVDFKDRKDGSCHVSYTVEDPGEYSVGIRFNDKHVPGSPYKVYIQPSADDAERVRLSNVAENPVRPDAPQTMLLNMNGADGDVECRIVAPSGREDDCFITPLGNGEHSVRFVPKEEGVHHLHARFNGVHIPGSPFKIIVGNMNNNDPSTVAVFGKGIQFGMTGEKSSFVIDTTSVGAGTLSITVDGPSKVDLSCNEVESGYEVSYTPMVPGKYYVTVKYNGKNVSSSPFSVNIGGDNLGGDADGRQRKSSRSSMTMETLKRTSYIRHQYTEQRTSSHSVSRSSSKPLALSSSSEASQVRCAGSGLKSAKLNKQNSFTVDCSKGGNNILYVGVYGPETPCDEVIIKHRGGKKYSVEYTLRQKGKYIIFVKWGDDHVAGSPYHIEV